MSLLFPRAPDSRNRVLRLFYRLITSAEFSRDSKETEPFFTPEDLTPYSGRLNPAAVGPTARCLPAQAEYPVTRQGRHHHALWALPTRAKCASRPR